MIRDEIVYGIGLIALLLFAFYIMPRYEHMANGSVVTILEADLAALEGMHDPKRLASVADISSIKSSIAKLKSDQASGKPVDTNAVKEIKDKISGYATLIVKSDAQDTNDSATVSKFDKQLSDIESMNDSEHKLSSADIAAVKALIAKLKADQVSGKPLDKKIADEAGLKLISYYQLLQGDVKPDAAAKSSLQYTNLTLPGVSDDYPSGPYGASSADKYVLKSSLVPGCQGGKGCIGGGGRNGFPTSVVPGDQDGAYADMCMISPNQYNLMNPDAWQTGGEEPKPFLTSFASFMK